MLPAARAGLLGVLTPFRRRSPRPWARWPRRWSNRGSLPWRPPTRPGARQFPSGSNLYLEFGVADLAEHDALPPPTTHVGRAEKPRGPAVDQSLLFARRRRKPDCHSAVAMVVVGKGGKHPLSDKERGRPVRESFAALGQTQTNRSHALDRWRGHSNRAPSPAAEERYPGPGKDLVFAGNLPASNRGTAPADR